MSFLGGITATPAAKPPDLAAGRRPSAPRLLYIATEDWYFLLHRLPTARAARAAGFEIHVATNVRDGAAAIAAEQFILHPVPFARGRLSPSASLKTVHALRRVHRHVEPAIVHHVSLQPIVLGRLAALGRPVASVNAFTGLGYSFTARTLKARALKRAIAFGLPLLLDRVGAVSVVENRDDLVALKRLGIAGDRIALIHGSGVDVDRFLPLAEPDGPPTIAFVGRLLEQKGVRTLVAALRLLQAQGSPVRLLIAGAPDPANPTSVTLAEVSSWSEAGLITWLGHVDDIAALWGRAHIAVLPSRGGEGVPVSLLEAAACARPMIATDVPGCREVVIPGKTGLLVPVEDPPALARAISTLAAAPQLRKQFGAAARQLAVSRFSAEIVGKQSVELYRALLA